MRYGEIMRLQWQDIDFENGFIRLERTKNNDRRSIPLMSGVSKIMNSLTQQQNEGYLFKSKRTGKSIMLWPAFARAVHRAHIDNFHDLRHTTASYLAMSGENLIIIAEILGHKTLAMVKRYAHLNQEHKVRALEKLQQNCNIMVGSKNEY